MRSGSEDSQSSSISKDDIWRHDVQQNDTEASDTKLKSKLLTVTTEQLINITRYSAQCDSDKWCSSECRSYEWCSTEYHSVDRKTLLSKH
jgi:hypothetical protein